MIACGGHIFGVHAQQQHLILDRPAAKEATIVNAAVQPGLNIRRAIMGSTMSGH